MKQTVNTNNDNIMSSSIGQASSNPNGQSPHHQFNDYICSRGIGKVGVALTLNDLIERSIEIYCLRNLEIKPLPIPTHPAFTQRYSDSGNGGAYRQRVLTMEVPTWRERIPRSDSVVEVANVKVYTLRYDTIRYYTRCFLAFEAVLGHFFVPISI
jgi:hypothetical protein